MEFKVFDTEEQKFVSDGFNGEFMVSHTGVMFKNRRSEGFYPSPKKFIPVFFNVLKDHETRALVNELRDTAVKYEGAQSLREAILGVVLKHLKRETK